MKIQANMRFHIALIITMLFCINNLSANDSIAAKAMKDEMARSMTELKYKDYSKPFFIQYELVKNTSTTVSASLGALITSRQAANNYANVRLMVGDYQLNDEKFYDNVNKVNYNDGYSPVPKDMNYWGIRRALWSSTNNIYKNASEKYKNKTGLMSQNDMNKDHMPSPDFSKESPNINAISPLPDEVSHTHFEKIAKQVSAIFLTAPELIESSVSIEYQNSTRLFLNSEGSNTRTPFRFLYIVVKAAIITKDNKTIHQKLCYNVNSVKDLPTLEEMKSDAALLIKNLKETAKATEFKGIYSGPVLVLYNAVSQVFLKETLQRNSGLIAKPNKLIHNKKNGLFYGEDNNDALIGKKVVDKNISIYSTPSKAYYNGKPLLGHCLPTDLEAVKTPDSLVLVEKGILKIQLNNRTPSTSQHHSNGHLLPYVNKTNMKPKIGGGVILFKPFTTKTQDELIAKQKEIAEEEGIEYVIVMKSLKSNADINPINYYKRNCTTGEEELVKQLNFNVSLKNLKSLGGVSGNMIMHNMLVTDQMDIKNRMKRYSRAPADVIEMMRGYIGTQGAPTSFIFPDALLIKSLELKGATGAFHTKRRVVPNPLAKK